MKNCNHNWVEYIGLQEVFDHCQDCGMKKSEFKEEEITEFPNAFMTYEEFLTATQPHPQSNQNFQLPVTKP